MPLSPAGKSKEQKAPSAPPALPLFWINKDASSASLSNSNDDAGREINAFVQRRQVAKGRPPKRRVQGKTKDAEHIKKSTADAPNPAVAASSASSAGSDYSDTLPSLTESQDTASTSSDITGLSRSNQLPDRKQFDTDEDLPLIRSICRAGEGLDPFHCTATPIDARIKNLLNVYINVTEPATWQVELKGQDVEDHRLRSASYKMVRDCMTSELHMYSLMASMASRVENFEMVPLERTGGTSAYTHKALVALRSYLATHPPVIEHRVIHDMYFLCLAEAYRYNKPGYMAHLRAVKYLVDRVGGLGSLDEHTKETFILGDVYLAAERLNAPFFPLDWDPMRLEPKKWKNVIVDTALMQLGRGFLSVMDDAVVTAELREIVNDIVQCVQVAQYTWTHPKSLVEYGRWVFLRNLAIIHRLASLKFGRDEGCGRAEVLRIALVQWLMLTMTELGPPRSVKVIAPYLKRALETCQRRGESWSSHAGILMWIVMVGTTTSNGLLEEKFFNSQLITVSSILRMRTEQQLHELSQRHLYLDRLQRKSLALLAKKLLGFNRLSFPASSDSTQKLTIL